MAAFATRKVAGLNSQTCPEGSVISYVSEVKVRKGESVDKALRRLKKKLDKEGVLRDVRAHRHFEKPSEKRRRKQARSRSRSRSMILA